MARKRKKPVSFLETMNINSENVSQSQPRELSTYITFLSNFVTNMYKWESNDVRYDELVRIEPILLTTGYCALIRPKIRINNAIITLPDPKIFKVNPTEWDNRQGMPISVTITDLSPVGNGANQETNIQRIYNKDEFAIISDFYNLEQQRHAPKIRMVNDYAQKLQELDYALHMNVQKLKMPIIGRSENQTAINNLKVAIEGMSNNAVAVYFDNGAVGDHNELFANFQVEYNVQNILDSQQFLIEDFAKRLGINIVGDNKGTYQAESVQVEGLGFNAFKRQIGYNHRMTGIMRAKELFNVDLRLTYFQDQIHDSSPMYEEPK